MLILASGGYSVLVSEFPLEDTFIQNNVTFTKNKYNKRKNLDWREKD